MLLEQQLQRLVIRPSTSCLRGKESVATFTQRRSSSTSFADVITNSRIPVPAASTPSRIAPSRNPPRSSYELARASVQEASRSITEEKRREQLASSRGQAVRADYERQMTRRWRSGDVYAPHDLSGAEMSKWKRLRRKPRPKYDVIDQLGIDPRQHYKNFAMMGEYMSEMGRIKGGSEAGLRPVNQRKMAKAIRRAIGMGLMPGVHRHPEMLLMEMPGRR